MQEDKTVHNCSALRLAKQTTSNQIYSPSSVLFNTETHAEYDQPLDKFHPCSGCANAMFSLSFHHTIWDFPPAIFPTDFWISTLVPSHLQSPLSSVVLFWELVSLPGLFKKFSSCCSNLVFIWHFCDTWADCFCINILTH